MATRKIETEISLGGEKAFNDAMRACNSNLKTLRSSMNAVTSEFRNNENSVEALTAKQKNLKAQLEQQREIVRALTERLEQAKSKYGEDSAQVDRLTQQLNDSTVAMHKTEDSLEAVNDELEEQTSVFARAKQAVSDYGRIAEGVAQTSQAAFSAIGKAAGGLAAAGGVVVGAIATIGVSALETITGFATDAAGRAQDQYDQANEYYRLAAEAAAAGNEDLVWQYTQMADALIAGINQDYLNLSFSLNDLHSASQAAQDAVGLILLPALTQLSDAGASLLNDFAADMQAAAGDTEAMGGIIADYVVRAADLIREQIPVFGQIAVDLIKGLGEGLMQEDNLNQLLDDLLGVVTYIIDTIVEMAPQIGTAASALITKLAEFITENLPTLLDGGMQIVTEIISGMAQNIPTLLTSVAGMVTMMLNKLVENAPELIAGGLKLIGEILVGLAQAIPTLLQEFIALPGKLWESFTSVEIDWKGIGSNIVNGIWQGIKDMWSSLVEWVEGAFSRLGDKISRLLGISSPSRWYRDHIGKMMAEGVGIGFEEGMDSVSDDMERSLMDAAPVIPFTSSFDGGAPSAGSTNFGGVTLIINGYNVHDDAQLAERIGYELENILERREA